MAACTGFQDGGAPSKNESGKPVRIMGVNIEITERKQAEETLQTTIRKLERSNQELEQFAYVCAHDLQAPLRQVSAFVQILKQRFGNELSGEAAKYFEYVHTGTVKMSDLIRGLLDYSQVGAGQPIHRRLMCEEILNAAIGNLGANISESGVRIEHDVLPAVLGDRMQLTQLFQNLISNAITYGRDGVVPEIQIGCHRDSTGWVFSVQDNGIGIAPEYYEKVFRMFQRLHVRERYPGTGIGLAICKKIVEEHHGRIWIDSKIGEGTTFFFTLPHANE
jgi:light-regulated signal transduction histidine kinase (bacteriophytochrome)